jgi:hypothetical protein
MQGPERFHDGFHTWRRAGRMSPLQAVNEVDHVGIMKSKVCRWKENVSGNCNLGDSHEVAA